MFRARSSPNSIYSKSVPEYFCQAPESADNSFSCFTRIILRVGKSFIAREQRANEPGGTENGYESPGLFVFVSAKASRAVGTATTPSPVTATKKMKIFPPVVTGYTSPYSTEARVVIGHAR